ncbi:hypothetical protein PAYE108092_21045 [Paracoccus yeei]
MGDPGRQEPARDRLSPGPRADAGLYRRPGGGGPGRDARRHQVAGRRSAKDQPAEPGRSGHRPLGHGRRIRHAPRLPAQRRSGIRTQHGALHLPEMGSERLQQFPRGAARHRHLPPGEPGIPGPDRLDRQGPERQRGGLSRHAGRHRQPHHHGQRPGRPGLGRRRDRGRGRDAGPADFHADPRGRGLQGHRRASRGRDRHRPGAEGRADAAQAWRGGQVRRILRRRP